jgi:chromosome segregation ATPase
LKRHVNHHKNENARIAQQLAHLNEEKANFQSFLQNIRDKLEEIERNVGE